MTLCGVNIGFLNGQLWFNLRRKMAESPLWASSLEEGREVMGSWGVKGSFTDSQR